MPSQLRLRPLEEAKRDSLVQVLDEPGVVRLLAPGGDFPAQFLHDLRLRRIASEVLQALSRSLAANAAWTRIIALADRLSHNLRFEWNRAKIQRDSMRLAELIDAADRNCESILGEGCRSLIAETEGNIPLAIEHRKKEVEMIRDLHAAVSGESFEEVATRGLDPKKLQQTMLALSRLYLDNGEISHAIETLQEARSYSKRKGLALDESPRIWRPNARQKQVTS